MKTEQEEIEDLKIFEYNMHSATSFLVVLSKVLARCVITPDSIDSNSKLVQQYSEAADSWLQFREMFTQLLKTEDVTSSLFATNIELALERGKLINSLKNQT